MDISKFKINDSFNKEQQQQGTLTGDMLVSKLSSKEDEQRPFNMTDVQHKKLQDKLINTTPEDDVLQFMEDDNFVEETKKFLKKNKVSDDDIFSLIDTIITTGTAFWEIKLFKKIPVIFRMRPAWVNKFILEKIEETMPRTYSRFIDLVSS